MAKDFRTDKARAQIEAATAAETRKPRKTYTPEEAAQAMATFTTSGRKGLKLPRINMGFTPTNFDYVHTMASVRGQSMTQYVNEMIDRDRAKAKNKQLYEKAKALQEEFKA